MALTPSNMLPLQTKAASFSLLDTISGQMYSLDDDTASPGTLIMFICNHCPYVKFVQEEFVQIAKDYIPQGIRLIAISSNDVEEYPDDSPEEMLTEAKKWAYPFPYLYDETQEVARAYNAACTPDFYLFDNDMSLVYRGQLDDSRPGNGIPITGRDLRAAMDDLLRGNPINELQIPSVGCNIKWKN